MCRSRGGGHLRYCSVAGDRLARLRIGPRHQTWDDRVMDTDMLAQIAGLWRGLSGGQTALQSSGVTVVESDRHRLSPSGWIGIVSLYDRVVIATPNEFRTVVDRGLAMSPAIDALTTVRGVAGVFGEPAQCLGPAVLAYGSGPTEAMSGALGPVAPSDWRVQRVLERCSPEERAESDLMRTDSGVFLSRDADGDPVSASGYRRWPESIAHMSVLTVPDARGAGYGTIAAAAALGLASSNGLLAQWRAAEDNQGSQRLAGSLGLTVIGRQLSFRPRSS